MFVGLVMEQVGTILLEFVTVATVQAKWIWRMGKVTTIEDKKFPRIVHILASEYASCFTGGLDCINRKTQDRLNEIEDKFEEMGIPWSDWSELVMAHFTKGEK